MWERERASEREKECESQFDNSNKKQLVAFNKWKFLCTVLFFIASWFICFSFSFLFDWQWIRVSVSKQQHWRWTFKQCVYDLLFVEYFSTSQLYFQIIVKNMMIDSMYRNNHFHWTQHTKIENLPWIFYCCFLIFLYNFQLAKQFVFKFIF